MHWYTVRCIFGWPSRAAYEERITIWAAESIDDAIEKAETEAAAYADANDCLSTGIAQAYAMFDEPVDGAEVYSLIRESDLGPDDYLDRFFSTGNEIATEED